MSKNFHTPGFTVGAIDSFPCAPREEQGVGSIRTETASVKVSSHKNKNIWVSSRTVLEEDLALSQSPGLDLDTTSIVVKESEEESAFPQTSDTNTGRLALKAAKNGEGLVSTSDLDWAHQTALQIAKVTYKLAMAKTCKGPDEVYANVAETVKATEVVGGLVAVAYGWIREQHHLGKVDRETTWQAKEVALTLATGNGDAIGLEKVWVTQDSIGRDGATAVWVVWGNFRTPWDPSVHDKIGAILFWFLIDETWETTSWYVCTSTEEKGEHIGTWETCKQAVRHMKGSFGLVKSWEETRWAILHEESEKSVKDRSALHNLQTSFKERRY